MPRFRAFGAALAAALFVCGCSASPPSGGSSPGAPEETSAFYVGMVTDGGSINDQSFNQSAWLGLRALAQMDPSYSVHYLLSAQAADYAGNLQQFARERYQLVWGIGYKLADAEADAARACPKQAFALMDASVSPTPENLTCVTFRVQESSFLVGYIAALKTAAGKVGFLGGTEGATIAQFEYGFRAGVAFGAKQAGRQVAVDARYAGSFDEPGEGGDLARDLYAAGSDILFAAAGSTGAGAIAEAKQEGRLIAGVDLDQAYLAPDNVLTSAIKNVGTVARNLTQNMRSGEADGGKILSYGLKDYAVGIPDTEQSKKLCGEDVLARAMQVQQQIIDGSIAPPGDAASFQSYLQALR